MEGRNVVLLINIENLFCGFFVSYEILHGIVNIETNILCLLLDVHSRPPKYAGTVDSGHGAYLENAYLGLKIIWEKVYRRQADQRKSVRSEVRDRVL